MKKILAGILFLGSMAAVSAQTIAFDRTVIDYGKVMPGSDGQRILTVKNTGTQPLIISDIKASCGCTTPQWSTDPIKPGGSAQIKVGYDTNIRGDFRKLIEVFSNDPENGRSVVWIQGNVSDEALSTDSKTPSGIPVTVQTQEKKVVKKKKK
ncbi:MAG: DUF1573 domain-containing protein [Chryseobacterium sp.]|nr:MAG: DUF1573 domain-containing protein [Chryseobacterium sp.]